MDDITISVTFQGSESITMDAKSRQLIRYRVEKKHGSRFTSDNVFQAVNEWCEDKLDIFPSSDWDFDWSIQGMKQKDLQQAMYRLIKDTKYQPPEIVGQMQIEEG